MKFYKVIICLALAIAVLGIGRVYAADINDLKKVTDDAKELRQKYKDVKEKYDSAMAVKQQIEAVRSPEQAFNVLVQNSSTLGIKPEDMQRLSTAFDATIAGIQAGKNIRNTIDQLEKDPAKVLSDPQARKRAEADLDTLIGSLETLEKTADELASNNKSSSTANQAGNDVSADAKETKDVAIATKQALASGDPSKVSVASENLSRATNNLKPKITATLASAVSTGGTTGATGPTEYSMGIKNWENQGSLVVGQSIAPNDIQTKVCDRIFAGDDKNLFKDVLCSLIRVVAASTAQFSTEMTCNIQSVPINSNYINGVELQNDGGICRATHANMVSPAHIYGVPEDQSTRRDGTGLYQKDRSSVLTASLVKKDGGTRNTFEITKWILAFGVMGALIFFAFANILHIDVNTYAVKKALPRAIVALVGGWLSLTIVALISRFVDITYRLNIFSPYQSLHPMANIFMGNFGSSTVATGTATATDNLSKGITLIFDIGGWFLSGNSNTDPSFAGMILGSFILIVPAIAVLIFEYVMALRPFIVQLLVATGPIAFAALVLPQTQFLFRKWWTYLLIALFYPLAVNFVFFFLSKIDIDSGASYGNGAFFAIWCFKIFIILLLARMPFTIERDTRRISQKIASSELGVALGLGKLLRKGGVQPNSKGPISGATSDNLSSEKAKQLIAPVTKRFFRNIVPQTAINTQSKGNLASSGQLQRMPFVPDSLARMIQNANQINSGRGSGLIQKSIQDLPINAMKAIVDRNDLQLWRDTRLIEQLKNQNGQILDDQGAAIRVDSVRKAVRMAQISENGRLVNGELIKTLAQKGMLSALPQNIAKEAVKQNILNKEDLIPSYGRDFKKVLDSDSNSLINATKARELMAQDHTDYLTGFNEIRNGINSAMKSGGSANQVVGAITDKIRQGGSGNLVKNSDYFLQRLGSDKNQAVTTLAGALTKAGVDHKPALSLAQNTSVGFDQITKYIPKQQQNDANFQQIKEGLLNRDVSTGLISEVSSIIAQEKTTVSRGITQKMAEVFKKDESIDISGVKKTVKETADKLNQPLSSAEIEQAASTINEFHPGARIKTNQQYDKSDIDQIKQKASEVLDTTEKLEKSGLDKKQIIANPIVASQAAEREINKEIQAKAKGVVATDSNFSDELGGIAKIIEGKA